jgi:hypothetical protein
MSCGCISTATPDSHVLCHWMNGDKAGRAFQTRRSCKIISNTTTKHVYTTIESPIIISGPSRVLVMYPPGCHGPVKSIQPAAGLWVPSVCMCTKLNIPLSCRMAYQLEIWEDFSIPRLLPFRYRKSDIIQHIQLVLGIIQHPLSKLYMFERHVQRHQKLRHTNGLTTKQTTPHTQQYNNKRKRVHVDGNETIRSMAQNTERSFRLTTYGQNALKHTNPNTTAKV